MENLTKIDLINIIGVDYNVYYDAYRKRFWCLDRYGKDVEGRRHKINNFYELPYRESARGAVWREFHKRLTDADKKLFPDYENMFIRWIDLEETGLVDLFREVEEDVLDSCLDAWAKENGLSVDWSHIDLN